MVRVMKRLLACVCLLGMSATAQAGTTMSGTIQPGTTLTLSATGSIAATPDEITATLTAQSTAAQPTAAQANLNVAMKKALDSARALPTVTVSTGSYTVYQTSPPGQPDQYQASQTLNLTMPAATGTPPPEFMTLLGKLQQNFLLLNNLDGDLSPARQASTQTQAVTAALRQLQTQSAQIAATIGQHVAGITSLSVDANTPPPIMNRMMAMSAPSAAPTAALGPITITATVTAVVALSR